MSNVSANDRDTLSRSAAGDRNPWLVAVVISIATFMQVLDTSIANVALQYIAGSLAASIDESTWVLTSYLVASAVVLPISGWLAGVIGRKRFYMLCVATFTVSSILCAMAPNLQMLIVFRVLQGLGGGGMAPSEQAMLADTFPGPGAIAGLRALRRRRLVAPTVGPTIGGWLTDNFSWHWIFLINGPIGLMSLVLVRLLVTEPEMLERERKERLARGVKIDWIGFMLVALFLGCLEIVLDKGQREDWFGSNFIIFFATVSVRRFLLFVPWELSANRPDCRNPPVRKSPVRRLLSDDADGWRTLVQHDPVDTSAVANLLRLHRDVVGSCPDAGRVGDAPDDAVCRRAR